METYICEYCGKPFQRCKRLRDDCRYCSRSCGSLGPRYGTKEEHDRILREKERKKEVSEYQRILHRLDKSKQIEFLICQECGALFLYSGMGGPNKTCSEECRTKRNNRIRRMRAREGKKRNKIRKRVKDFTGYDSTLTVEKVYEKDNGICYLCGKPCDWNDYKIIDNAFIAGPHYPSRDHVVPLSRGGRHIYNNIRLAHMICNSLKSDKAVDGV